MQRQLERLQPLLDVPIIRRIRRNHGLEHATIHLLSQRVPNLKMVGRSDAGGFWLYGTVNSDDVHTCAATALERMRGGERRLAVHPNCGTNLVTVATIGALAALIALIGSEGERYGKLTRLPIIIAGIILAIIIGQPLGMQLQEYVTTSGDPADLEIVTIHKMMRGKLVTHRVETRSS
jgi:hypothetical protein